MPKGQGSTEMIVVLAIALAVFLAIFSAANQMMDSAGTEFQYKLARTSLDDIALAAKEVYYQGEGSKIKIYVDMPTGIEYTEVLNRTISVQLGTSQIYRNLDFKVVGFLPEDAGYSWVYIYAGYGYISITRNATPIILDYCGNDYVGPEEVCDGLNMTPYSSDCGTFPPYVSGTLSCLNNCSGYITDECRLSTFGPPGSVTDLHDESTGIDWIYWVWNNPPVEDFRYAIVYLDGVNIANTTDPFINITGLLEGNIYELTIHTMDTEGYINDTDVNDIAMTDIPSTIEYAKYDSLFTAPYCSHGYAPCVANSSLLNCRDSISDGNGPESNQPNTIDTCTDGTKTYSNPSCGHDESVENITIIDLNGTLFRPGDTVSVEAWVSCYASYNDHLGLVYTNRSDFPNWRLVEFREDGCTKSGYQKIIFDDFVIDKIAGDHSFRVYITFDTVNPAPQRLCAERGGSRYDDNDDLVFKVYDEGFDSFYSVSGIADVKRGTDWIFWVWYNPTNPNFDESIIYLDGVNVANTSDAFYNATGLLDDTDYIITIHTKDKDGDVYSTDVNDTGRTIRIITPPGSVKDITTASKSFDWIYWTWTNPTDPNFDRSKIYIDGFPKSETSNNFYNATSLSPDANHTITIHTIDTEGDLNETDVSAVESTDAEPITVPGSITDLSNQSQGFDWIYWTWTNPTDTDFSQSIIYIDGVNVVNTSADHYNATGLLQDTTYTITVHTKDTSGFVNDTDVADSATTYLFDPPPSTVTGLADQSKGTSWIYWTWNNPGDIDFDYAIVYLDGINVINTTNTYFNATGLPQDSTFSLTIHTIDTAGNINDTDVTDGAVTGSVPSFSTVVSPQTCIAEQTESIPQTWGTSCDGNYPNTCGSGKDMVTCNDGVREVQYCNIDWTTHTYGGLKMSYFKSSVTDCGSIIRVEICYEWWTTGTVEDCDISVDADGDDSWSAAITSCPSTSANKGVICTDVSALESWSCSNFFGASGTRAGCKSEIKHSGAAGNRYNQWDVLYFNVTYTVS